MKDKQLRFIISLSLISFFGIFGLAQLTAAQSLLPSCTATGNCTICDIVQTGINIGGAIIAIVGSLILLMFVYGGVLWLISAGRPDYVKKGKDVLINSLIGLGIIMTAYLAVTAVISVVTSGSSGQEWNWQGKLTCVPIDFSPKPPDNAANLTSAINVPPDDYGGGAGGSGLPAGSPCQANKDCKGFCSNIDNKELPKNYKDDKAGKNKFEINKCYDKLPADAGCEDVAKENDNNGCVSGKCSMSAGMDYCIGGSKKKTGEDCTKSDECEGFCPEKTTKILKDVLDKGNTATFDVTKGKCADKLPARADCTEVAVGDDDVACVSGVCDEGWNPDYCKSANNPPGTACKNNEDCAGFCASKTNAAVKVDIDDDSKGFITPTLVEGKCHAYLPNKAECEDVAVGFWGNLFGDDAACAGGECDARAGMLDYCKQE